MKMTRKPFIAFTLVFMMLFSLAFSFTAYAEDQTALDEGLVAHYEFSDNLVDSSGHGNDGKWMGKGDYAPAVFGKGAKFANNAYIQVANSDSLNLTKDFTFSFWVYKDPLKDIQDGVAYFAKMNEEGMDYPYGMYEWNRFTPAVFYTTEDTSGNLNSNATVVDINQWTLLTATYDGEHLSIYINDGIANTELADFSMYTSSQPLNIGVFEFMNKLQNFSGIMDDFRIYNRGLSAEDVQALYEEGLEGDGKDRVTKPNKLVAFYKFDDNANDVSGFGNNGKPTNSKKVTYVNGIVGKAAKFDGAAYIKVPDSETLDLDKSYTISSWVYEESNKNSPNHPILAKTGYSHDYQYSSYALQDYENGGVVFFGHEHRDFQTTEQNFASNWNTPVNKWFQYTITYDGKNVTTYINGDQIATEEYDGIVAHSKGELWIGSNGPDYFKGMLDEIRIYNYALTSEEVGDLYDIKDTMTVTSGSLANLNKGASVKLTVKNTTYTYTPAAANAPVGSDVKKVVDVTNTATYKSSKPDIASVSATGNITALKAGTTNITVTVGAQVKTLKVTVKK